MQPSDKQQGLHREQVVEFLQSRSTRFIGLVRLAYDFPVRLVDRRVAGARGAAELSGPPDAGDDEIVDGWRYPQYC